MTTMIFIRHGQSEGNLLHVCCGQKDYPLTPLGLKQAQMTAGYLKEHYAIDYIYASSLTRTMQTAAPTAEAFGMEIIPSDEFKELCGGMLEGMPKKEIEEKYNDLHTAWCNGENICPEGGETKQQMLDRLFPFFEGLLKKHRGKCVALFGHWGPIYEIYRTWADQCPALKLPGVEKNPISNSSVTAVEYDDNGNFVKILELGYNGHLGKDTSDSVKGLV